MNDYSFDSIIQFFNYKTNCIFCESRLFPKICNYSYGSIPHQKIDGNFIFLFNHCVSVNLYSNLISYTSLHDYNKFIKHFPYFMLSCQNNYNCNYNYYVASCVISTNFSDGKFFVSPICLNFSAFSYDKFWIQNSYSHKKTYVYIKESPETDPIAVDMINFDKLPQNKIISKIKFLTTFS